MKVQPPEITDMQPQKVAAEYKSAAFNEEIKVLTGVCRFAAEELSTEPYLRSMLKELMRTKGTISTEPTEKGKKDLDVFHPSYRVKHIKDELLSEKCTDDLFIEIERMEEQGLIKSSVQLPKEQADNFSNYLLQHYLHSN